MHYLISFVKNGNEVKKERDMPLVRGEPLSQIIVLHNFIIYFREKT